ncbi:MAG: putative pterin-binding protein [Rhodospirillales bacterium]
MRSRYFFRIWRRAAAHALAAAALVFAAAQPVWAADPLPQPTGKVILTVTGDITVTNADGEAHFDLDMLRALGEHSVTTSEPFASGVHTFKGVLLSDILARVGAKGETMTAKGLDDYNADMPVQDTREYPVMVAYEQNGKMLRVRSKGPLRTIYPIDQYPELKTNVYESRTVWQLRYLDVR